MVPFHTPTCPAGSGRSPRHKIRGLRPRRAALCRAVWAEIPNFGYEPEGIAPQAELGNTNNKTVVNDVESAIVNHIKETPVRGYEVFAQEVTMTTNGYYRAWIGLRLPLGEFNKMYNYTVESVVDAYKLKELAENAYKDVEVEIVNQ